MKTYFCDEAYAFLSLLHKYFLLVDGIFFAGVTFSFPKRKKGLRMYDLLRQVNQNRRFFLLEKMATAIPPALDGGLRLRKA